MVSGFGESTSMMPSSPYFLCSNNANDADGCTIIRIIKNAQFAGPSYRRINSFLLIVGGKNQTDPPTTAALPTLTNQFANYGFGLMGGFAPMATARIGAIMYGTTSGFPHAFNIVHGGHAQGFPQPIARGQ
ncbi:hypothetical protein Goari_000019 [Gossypium aridum]|uniref:Uncharacterized protein n=1 Tax=Gossypium aridum TaxID=34290 RepID=A0A7J8YLX9_GOSAI|nr:hypothetical protein [Gossypium aridum]